MTYISLTVDRDDAKLLLGATLTYAAVPFKEEQDNFGINMGEFHEQIFQLFEGQFRHASHTEVCLTFDQLRILIAVFKAVLDEYKDGSMELEVLVGRRDAAETCLRRLCSELEAAN